MSDDGTLGWKPGSLNTPEIPDPQLYGATAEPLRPSAGDQTDQLAQFVRQQPFTAALVALIVGYFIGKIT